MAVEALGSAYSPSLQNDVTQSTQAAKAPQPQQEAKPVVESQNSPDDGGAQARAEGRGGNVDIQG